LRRLLGGGDVAHLAPPADSLIRQAEKCHPRWVIFPQFRQGAQLSLIPETKSLAFTRLSNNSFNYQISMAQGFDTLSRLTQEVDCYRLMFGDLDQAVQALDQLVEDDSP